MAERKRLIAADELMKAIKDFRWFGVPNTLKLMFEYLELIIRDQPTVEAVPVVHARWKYYRKQNIAVCTNCSFERDLDANFGKAISCPNCGATMDLKN